MGLHKGSQLCMWDVASCVHSLVQRERASNASMEALCLTQLQPQHACNTAGHIFAHVTALFQTWCKTQVIYCMHPVAP